MQTIRTTVSLSVFSYRAICAIRVKAGDPIPGEIADGSINVDDSVDWRIVATKSPLLAS